MSAEHNIQTSKLRVVIADDYVTVSEGFKLIVDSQPDMEVVGVASNGNEAVAIARELSPDVLLLDISMPELNGLQAATQLNAVAPTVKILTLTRHTDDAYVNEMFKAGVSGYLAKQSASDELVRAIRTVAAGGKYRDPALSNNGFAPGRNGTLLLGDDGGKPLSERETDVVRLIALGHSNKEIAAQLDISVKTVEAHKANATHKLNINGLTGIVRYAIFKGWLDGE